MITILNPTTLLQHLLPLNGKERHFQEEDGCGREWSACERLFKNKWPTQTTIDSGKETIQKPSLRGRLYHIQVRSAPFLAALKPLISL